MFSQQFSFTSRIRIRRWKNTSTGERKTRQQVIVYKTYPGGAPRTWTQETTPRTKKRMTGSPAGDYYLAMQRRHREHNQKRKILPESRKPSREESDRPLRFFRENLDKMVDKTPTKDATNDTNFTRTTQKISRKLREKQSTAVFQKSPGENQSDKEDGYAKFQKQRWEPAPREKKRKRATSELVYRTKQELPCDEEEKPFRQRPPESLKLYISCHPGLQNVVYEELKELGYKYTEKGNGVLLTAETMRDVFRCHVWLGSAARIFLYCGEPFRVRALGELERKVAKFFPWKDLIDCRGDIPTVKVKTTASKSRLIHTNALNDRVKRGIYSVIGEPTCSEMVYLSLQIFRDTAVLSFDTMNGDPLYRRGYRVCNVKAPLREDMAYALLWKRKLRDYEVFFDPFCGSGTIPIEAATVAAGLPPGHMLPPPLQRTALFDEALWNEVKQERRDTLDIKVYASDRDPATTQAAKTNIKKAGFDFDVDMQVFSSHPMWEERDKRILMVTNPPFGVRLKGPKAEKKRLYNLELYQTLAKRMNTWKDRTRNGAVILTNSRHSWRPAGFEGEFQYMASFVHGGIKVTALDYYPLKTAKPPGEILGSECLAKKLDDTEHKDGSYESQEPPRLDKFEMSSSGNTSFGTLGCRHCNLAVRNVPNEPRTE